MMPDKTVLAKTDGLNQCFRISDINGLKTVKNIQKQYQNNTKNATKIVRKLYKNNIKTVLNGEKSV